MLQTKNKLLQAKSNKLQANNGVQILPGPITLKEQLAGSSKLVGCETADISDISKVQLDKLNKH